VSPPTLRIVKPEIRVLGVDDGKFVPHSKAQVPVVGVVFRGGYWIDGVMSTKITVDGLDATQNIADMITRSPHFWQLRVVMLNGVTFGGFNVVDIKALNEQTKLPVIAVTEKKPDLAKVHAALKHLPNCQERWSAIVNAGELFPMLSRVGKKRIYVELAGVSEEVAAEVLRLTATRSKIPEALRVAHLVASGISLC
jgi:uncharacterized protein